MKLNMEDVVENIFSIRHSVFKKFIDRELINDIIPIGTETALILLSKNGDLMMTEIGNELGLPKSNVTTIVDKLVDANLVERIDDKNDRRIIRISITDNGRQTLKKARAILAMSIKDKLEHLPEPDLVDLDRSLKNIMKIVSKI